MAQLLNTSTKIFAKALMASEDIQSFVGSCKFGAVDGGGAFQYAEIYDGAFVNIGGLDADLVYSTTTPADVLDWNVHQAVAPATGSLTREDICVIDIANISEVTVFGNFYKGIDTRLVNLTRPAGAAVRFRRMAKGDKFWLGGGNFKAVPQVGQFGNVVNGETTLTAGDSATAGQFAVKVLTSKPLTIGNTVTYANSAWEQLYLCEVQ